MQMSGRAQLTGRYTTSGPRRVSALSARTLELEAGTQPLQLHRCPLYVAAEYQLRAAIDRPQFSQLGQLSNSS